MGNLTSHMSHCRKEKVYNYNKFNPNMDSSSKELGNPDWNGFEVRKRICIIGAGWYGCHIGCKLAEEGYDVTILEQNDEIFCGSSDKSSYRLHLGPHYPRSKETRTVCKEGFRRFCEEYPDLVVKQHEAIYAVGKKDADGNPSMCTWEHFQKITLESDPLATEDKSGRFTNILGAMNCHEATVLVDEPRYHFKAKLQKLGVRLLCSTKCWGLKDEHTVIMQHLRERAFDKAFRYERFDFVLNCTYFQAFQNFEDAPFTPEQVIYQPVLTLVYGMKNKADLEKAPFSFTVMDGAFGSIDPMEFSRDHDSKNDRLYIVTHAKYSALCSSPDIDLMLRVQNKYRINPVEVEQHLEPLIADDMERYYPNYKEELEYRSYFVSMKTKVYTEAEYRGAFVWKEKNSSMIHVFAGKIDTIFDAADDVLKILNNEQSKTEQLAEALFKKGVSYADGKKAGKGPLEAMKDDELESRLKELREDLAAPWVAKPNKTCEEIVEETLSRAGVRLATPMRSLSVSVPREMTKFDGELNKMISQEEPRLVYRVDSPLEAGLSTVPLEEELPTMPDNWIPTKTSSFKLLHPDLPRVGSLRNARTLEEVVGLLYSDTSDSYRIEQSRSRTPDPLSPPQPYFHFDSTDSKTECALDTPMHGFGTKEDFFADILNNDYRPSSVCRAGTMRQLLSKKKTQAKVNNSGNLLVRSKTCR